MADLSVEPENLLQLAEQQKDSAKKIKAANDGGAGMLAEVLSFGEAIKKPITTLYGALNDDGPGIWFSHGPACFRSIMALGHALDAREEAAEKMEVVCTELAERLYDAAGVYRFTDEKTSDNLDNQMLTP